MTHPFQHVCQKWLAVIKAANEKKLDRFQKYANEAYQFFNGPANYMWEQMKKPGETSSGVLGEAGVTPAFQMQVNRLFEAVALFGPTLVHKFPQVSITAVKQTSVFQGVDPSMLDPESVQLLTQEQDQRKRRELCADLKQDYANWLQVEAKKKEQARFAVTEGIVKGMGLLMVEMHQPPGSQIKYPKSSFLSVDDLAVDPDARYWDSVQWCAVRRKEARHVVEQKYGLPKGTIKGQQQSAVAQQAERAPAEAKAAGQSADKGITFDLVEYWEIYSKQGFGDLLRYEGTPQDQADTSFFGQFCYLAVCEGVPFPLNIPTAVLNEEDDDSLMQRVQWPIPFWMDGGWPFADLGFYKDPNSVWPIGLAKQSMGYLRFLNWCYSFLADKVAASCTTYVAMFKDAAKEIRDQLVTGNTPFKQLEIERITGMKLSEIISFLDAPSFDINIWKMIDAVGEKLDKSMGLSELLYGMTSSSLRSATEAQVKQENLQIRPDDMSATVDDWFSALASKEIQAACWKCDEQDFAQVLGPLGARYLTQTLAEYPPDTVVRDYQYRVVAESSRKPNKAAKQESLNTLGQTIIPTIQAFAQQGMTGPWNAYVSDMCDALDLDGEKYMVPEFQPPQPQQTDPMAEEDAKHQATMEEMAFEQQHESIENELDRRSKEKIAASKPKPQSKPQAKSKGAA